jgi:hypothetical protein
VLLDVVGQFVAQGRYDFVAGFVECCRDCRLQVER